VARGADAGQAGADDDHVDVLDHSIPPRSMGPV
jgi:hypothetical protein